jgi:hypothetical protein
MKYGSAFTSRELGLEQAAEKSKTGAKSVPQGLKPRVVSIVYGTAEGVPFH